MSLYRTTVVHLQMMVKGLHHITLVTGNYAVNRMFYTGVLGLRQVKLSVNQDDIYHRHAFYANPEKPTGSAITFFEWPEIPNGFPGFGSPHHLAYRVKSVEALAKWYGWLRSENVKVKGPVFYGGLVSIYFTDPDDCLLELAAGDDGVDKPYVVELFSETSPPNQLTADMKLLAFDHVSPLVGDAGLVRKFLEKFLDIFPETTHVAGKIMFNVQYNEQPYIRYVVNPSADDGYVGRGSIHHFAVAVETEEDQRTILRKLNLAGIPNSGIVDRHWFKSLYFRDPDGNLMEVATVGPGYDVDEPRETMGSRLVLPPWLENMRDRIESRLAERDKVNQPVWPPDYAEVPENHEPLLDV
ncbi:MAG: VOC family protein [Candidatus Caldarchaeum sp.]|nr:VOC family protein [Candidatus Caldarchaeum sp.]